MPANSPHSVSVLLWFIGAYLSPNFGTPCLTTLGIACPFTAAWRLTGTEAEVGFLRPPRPLHLTPVSRPKENRGSVKDILPRGEADYVMRFIIWSFFVTHLGASFQRHQPGWLFSSPPSVACILMRKCQLCGIFERFLALFDSVPLL